MFRALAFRAIGRCVGHVNIAVSFSATATRRSSEERDVALDTRTIKSAMRIDMPWNRQRGSDGETTSGKTYAGIY